MIPVLNETKFPGLVHDPCFVKADLLFQDGDGAVFNEAVGEAEPFNPDILNIPVTQ